MRGETLQTNSIQRKRWIAALLWAYCAALATVSLWPVGPTSPLAATTTRCAVNNALHVPAYAGLTVLWALHLGAGSAAGFGRRVFVLAKACGMALVFGGLVEWLQNTVPHRAGTWNDMALNAAGVLAAGLMVAFLCRRGVQRGATES